MEPLDCLVPMCINMTCHGADGKSGARQVSIFVICATNLAPGHLASPVGLRLSFLLTICRHSAQPCEPRKPTPSRDLCVAHLRQGKLGERTIMNIQEVQYIPMWRNSPIQKMLAGDPNWMWPLCWSEEKITGRNRCTSWLCGSRYEHGGRKMEKKGRGRERGEPKNDRQTSWEVFGHMCI